MKYKSVKLNIEERDGILVGEIVVYPSNEVEHQSLSMRISTTMPDKDFADMAYPQAMAKASLLLNSLFVNQYRDAKDKS